MTVKECRQILQVTPEAGLDEIKRSFRRLAFELHPDLHPDDPGASRKFQRLNEAYVFLRKAMEASDPPQEEPSPAPGPEQAKGGQAGKQAQAKAGFRDTRQGPPGSTTAEERARERMRRKYAANEKFFHRREEVLQDILKDPFARKVFEDIYQQVRSGVPQAASKEIKRRKLELEWGKRKISIDLSKGFVGSIKAWVQGQMDVHKTIRLPIEHLKPGRTVRISVSTGLSSVQHAIEIRLPSDFSIGKAIRLRGMGRKLGGLQGDMYLRIMAK